MQGLFRKQSLPDQFKQICTSSAPGGGGDEMGEEEKKKHAGRYDKHIVLPAMVEKQTPGAIIKLSVARGEKKKGEKKKKHVTVVTGLRSPGIDLKVAAKFFGKTFACGSTLTWDDEIVIQRDVKDALLELIPKQWPSVRKDQMEDLGELDNCKILPLDSISPSRSEGTVRVYVKSKDPLQSYRSAKGLATAFGMWLQDESEEMKCSAFGNEATKFHGTFQVGKVLGTVRAYVKNKDPIRSYQNAKGPGSVFGMWLQDESEEVKCCAFGNEATTFHELVEVGKWYYIRDAGIIVPKDELYSRGKQYEMLMMPETLVTPCLYMRDRPKVQFHFTPISKLGEKLAGADVVLSRDLIKRDIELREQEFSVRVTLSGSSAENFDKESVNHVVAIKDCSVSDFGGRTLSTVSWSDIIVDPDIDEARVLRSWYQTKRASTAAHSVAAEIPGRTTQWKCFRMVKDLQNPFSDWGIRPEYFQVKATIMNVANLGKQTIMYRGCPGAVVSRANSTPITGTPWSCNKKLVEIENGSYHCGKCLKYYDTFVWRLVLQIDLADFGGNLKSVTVFHEHGECMVQRTAQELGELYTTDRTRFDKVIQAIVFKSFIFKLSAKIEIYEAVSRMKFTVVNLDDLDFVTYSKHLAKDFKKLTK